MTDAYKADRAALALFYAQAGVQIFPFFWDRRPDGSWNKRPLIKRFQLAQSGATADEAIIRQRWARWPDAGIAVVCGLNGLFVLDGDRHGKGDGVTELEKLGVKSSVETYTGGNGRHVIYALPAGVDAGELGGGPWGNGVIDVKCGSGWIVAPGNINPDGKKWRAVVDGKDDIGGWAQRVGRRTLPEAPTAIIEMVRKPKASASAGPKRPEEPTSPEAGAAGPDNVVGSDGQNYRISEVVAMFAACTKAGVFVDRKEWMTAWLAVIGAFPDEAIQDRIMACTDDGRPANPKEIEGFRTFATNGGDARMKAGLGRWVIRALQLGWRGNIHGDASGADKVDPRPVSGALDIPPMPAFDSCPLDKRTMAAARAADLDVNIVLASAIGMAANLVGERFDVRIFGGAKGITTLTIGLARTGEGKSQVLNALTRDARRILDGRMRRAMLAAANFQEKFNEYRNASEVDPPRAEALIPRRVLAGNATPQVVSQALTRGAPPAIIISDEISTLFTVAEGNNFYALLDLLIMAADHTVEERQRINDGVQNKQTVAEALMDVRRGDANGSTRLSTVGLTQPETWTKTVLAEGRLKKLESRGALARLFVFPPTGEVDPARRMEAGGNAREALAEMAVILEKLARHCTMFVRPTGAYRRAQGTLPLLRVKGRGGERIVVAPAVPAGVMLSDDAREAPCFRLEPETEAAIRKQAADMLRQALAGHLGAGGEVLRGIFTRLPDKVAQVAATLHAVNTTGSEGCDDFFARGVPGLVAEGPYRAPEEPIVMPPFRPFADVDPAPLGKDDPALMIPHAVAMDAFGLVAHVTFAAIDGGYYGLGAQGRTSRAAARIEAMDAPTPESEAIASAAERRGILLGKLSKAGATGVTARALLNGMGKGQRARFGDVEAVRAELGKLVSEGKVTATGEPGRETYRGV